MLRRSDGCQSGPCTLHQSLQKGTSWWPARCAGRGRVHLHHQDTLENHYLWHHATLNHTPCLKEQNEKAFKDRKQQGDGCPGVQVGEEYIFTIRTPSSGNGCTTLGVSYDAFVDDVEVRPNSNSTSILA